MTAEGPALALAGVTVRYPARRTPALDGVDMAVAAGRKVAVGGRTGAGKSTLALVSAGFIPRVVRARVDGQVQIDGIQAATADASALLGRVGIVFATPANQLSASKLTVREELAFGLENLGLPRPEMDARIEATLERLAIAHLAEREPFALSGGEQQRVAIASIVAMGTRVLVLDEPTAQLDPSGTVSVAELLDELATGGSTVLCTEHDPVVLGRADEVVVLEAGRIAVRGGPATALSSAALGPLGLRAPTLVRLAEAAGLGPDQAFDEAAVADGLRRRPRAEAPGSDAATAAIEQWIPIREGSAVAVELDALVHRYPPGVEAVRGVSLRIEPGETVAIVGQNGSGKTTLVKHLVGLLRPTAGRVLIDGRDAAGEPIHRLAATIGFVFQNPDDQLFERSVEREVAFGPRTLGIAGADLATLVDRAIGIAGLEDARATNPYDLDLSRRKLVGLASTLATDPRVVVLDEPTTGQDGPGVERVGAVIESLRGAGRTVVAITHDMEFAARHFGRIVVMRTGEVVADGPPAEVFGPRNAELLASTGLTPPPAARIAERLGLEAVPPDAEALLRFLAGRAGRVSAPG